MVGQFRRQDRVSSLCEKELCDSVKIENVVARLVMAKLHHAAKLKEYCIDHIASSRRRSWQQRGDSSWARSPTSHTVMGCGNGLATKK
jgi:hypothetical protein